jgi:deoxyguanosine kinase
VLAPYVAFEGPLGVGKSTLARKLAEYLNAVFVEELFAENDFLPDYYEQPDRWAFPMQLWFLLARKGQAHQVNGARGAVVADFSPLKEAIFARELLRVEREYQLYRRVAELVSVRQREPDLIIYLDADDRTVLERIRGRNRPYETTVDRAYLARVRTAYEEALLKLPTSKVLRYDTSALDIASDETLKKFYALVTSQLSMARPHMPP